MVRYNINTRSLGKADRAGSLRRVERRLEHLSNVVIAQFVG
jgi:hypothetical protein